jgi:hypothetical protein
MPRRAAVLRWTVVIAQLALAGCATAGGAAARVESGGVTVQVFADEAAVRARRPGPAGAVGELERRLGERWVTVFRTLSPAWAVAGLPPGGYRVRVRSRVNDAGREVRVRERVAEIEVAGGELAGVELVLDSGAAMVAGAAAAATAAAVMREVLDYERLRRPPPAGGSPAGVPARVFDLRLAEREAGEPDRGPPVVTAHLPQDGALVSARRPHIVLALSEPPGAAALLAGALTVTAEADGPVAGTAAVDRERWWVVWEPEAALPAGRTLRVTLAAGAVADAAGNALQGAVSFTFVTAL